LILPEGETGELTRLRKRRKSYGAGEARTFSMPELRLGLGLGLGVAPGG